MVKSGTDRSDKYGQKFDAEVVRARYAATADSSKAKQLVMQGLLASRNAEVREILNVAGIMPIQTVQYQAFGNKLFGICKKFAGLVDNPHLSASAIAQAYAEYTKWVAYQSEPSVLESIWAKYSTMLGDAPSPLISP
jgi:hypothetical protein